MMSRYFDSSQTEEITIYSENHSDQEPDYLAQLTRETWQKAINPRMLSGKEQGRLLSLFSKMIRPIKIIELGTYTGYSALCLAEGLRENGELITIDHNDELTWIQKKYFELSPFAHCIKTLNGDAMNALNTIDLDVDIAFIDADKVNYLNYYKKFRGHMRKGSWIIADNVLWSGKVIDPKAQDEETEAIRTFNEFVLNDRGVSKLMWPIRDGMTLIQIIQ
jgi:predicted O-methyltransferase YrrM